MVLSISGWNEYSNLSHSLMMALQGGDKKLVDKLIPQIVNSVVKLRSEMDKEIEKDEQYNGLIK